MKHFSFFTGLGGFDIAAESLGIKNIGHCEIDDYLRSHLEFMFHTALMSEFLDHRETRVDTFRSYENIRDFCQKIRIATE